MASCSTKSADETNFMGKRGPNFEWETKRTAKKHKDRSEEKETTQGFAADNLPEVKGRVVLLETKPAANLIPVKKETADEIPYFVEGVLARKKTLIIDNLSVRTRFSDIINFFEDVGRVVGVRRVVDSEGLHFGFGSVEFASAKDARKAQEKKNGEYLRGKKITLGLAEITPYPQRPRFCREHTVSYQDYLQRESFPIGGGEEMPPGFFEAFAARKETIFVANLSPQTKMLHIIDFFEDVGDVASVRLIVNHEGRHVGYGFVEFVYAYNAKKALEEKNGKYLHDHKIFLHGAKTTPYSPRPKYSLVEKLWYEECLLLESPRIKKMKTLGLDETSNFVVVRKKTLFIDNLSCQTIISDIINFFKDVAEVVHVRLIVDESGDHVGYGFVECASFDEAKEAQKKKNGEYLHGNQITVGVAEIAPYHPPPMYCIDHKVWYEDYLRGESLLIDVDEAMERLGDFVEEVSVRKKTIFIDKLPFRFRMRDLIDFFQDVGEVSVRLIVDYEGKLVRCGFVKFASAIEATEALKKRDRLRAMPCDFVFLDVAEIAPYPLRPKYNLAEKLWCEDYLWQQSLPIEEVNRKKQFCGKKITFSYDDD